MLNVTRDTVLELMMDMWQAGVPGIQLQVFRSVSQARFTWSQGPTREACRDERRPDILRYLTTRLCNHSNELIESLRY